MPKALLGVALALSLAPAAHASPARLIYIGDWSGSSEVYSVDPARPESLAQLTFGHEPSCDPLDDSCGVSGVLPSPDGRHVAFGNGAYCRPGYLYVARADGRAPRRIAPFGACGETGFDWAPDSRRLAYAANGFVYVVGSDGSHRRRVAVGGDPVWSPDGHALARVSGQSLPLSPQKRSQADNRLERRRLRVVAERQVARDRHAHDVPVLGTPGDHPAGRQRRTKAHEQLRALPDLVA